MTTGQVRIRPIRPSDEQALREGFQRLSFETIRQRFFAPVRELTEEMARHLANVDQVTRGAVVAETESSGLIGVARYEPSDEPGVVEVAVVVADEWQNIGIGRQLFKAILEAAKANGIDQFRADVLADNYRMLHLLSTETAVLKKRTQSGVTSLFFSYLAATNSPEACAFAST